MKWTVFFLFLPTFFFAQNTASFETTFCFEDAIGNRDSIVIGNDLNANSIFNPEFGEEDITDPWDSVFEVRAAHYLDFSSLNDELVLSKKIIGSTESNIHPSLQCYPLIEGIVFFVNLQNFPLKIEWNKDEFGSSLCRNRSVLTPHVLPYITPYWFDGLTEDIDYSCLAERDSASFSEFRTDDGFQFYLIDEIESNTVDTMVAVLLYFKYQGSSNSPCSAVVSTNDIEEDESNIKIFPNPTSQVLNISGDEYSYWYLLDAESRLMKKGSESTIDLGGFGSGVYYLSLFDERRQLMGTKTFVKLE